MPDVVYMWHNPLQSILIPNRLWIVIPPRPLGWAVLIEHMWHIVWLYRILHRVRLGSIIALGRSFRRSSTTRLGILRHHLKFGEGSPSDLRSKSGPNIDEKDGYSGVQTLGRKKRFMRETHMLNYTQKVPSTKHETQLSRPSLQSLS